MANPTECLHICCLRPTEHVQDVRGEIFAVENGHPLFVDGLENAAPSYLDHRRRKVFIVKKYTYFIFSTI